MQGKNKNFIKYTVAAVMLMMMCLQYVLIQTVHISPWKGGGFGMFSTINTPISHIVRVYNNSNGKKTPVLIPESLKPFEKNIRHIAAGYNIDALKKALQKEKWILKDSTLILANEKDSLPLTQLNSLTVELWRYKFDIETKRFYSVFIESY